MEPGPFIIETDTGPKRYYDVTGAAKTIGMSNSALWRWVREGATPWGLELDVVRQPLLRTSHSKPRSNRQVRLLLSEASVFALKELLEQEPIRRGPLSDRAFSHLRHASRHLKGPQ
jgi:hypothetical protein